MRAYCLFSEFIPVLQEDPFYTTSSLPTLNETLTLRCVTTTSDSSITWLKKGAQDGSNNTLLSIDQNIVLDNPRLSTSKVVLEGLGFTEHHLQIDTFSMDDQGTYICQVVLPDATQKTSAVDVLVKEEVKVSYVNLDDLKFMKDYDFERLKLPFDYEIVKEPYLNPTVNLDYSTGSDY